MAINWPDQTSDHIIHFRVALRVIFHWRYFFFDSCLFYVYFIVIYYSVYWRVDVSVADQNFRSVGTEIPNRVSSFSVEVL